MTDHTDLLHALVRFCRERQQHYTKLTANAKDTDTWADSHYTGAVAGHYEMEQHLQQLIDRPSPPTDHTDPENQFILHDRIQALEAKNARLREANETWATDYAVQDKAFRATAQQRDELEAENARLHERLNVVIQDREEFVRKMNEARYWAQHYRSWYLEVKANIMGGKDGREHPNWLPSNDPDWIPF